jgi:hypothetical protein
MYIGDLHGGTLTYSRKLIDDGMRFQAVSLAEDTYFLMDAKRRGARIAKLPNEEQFVYGCIAESVGRFAVESYGVGSGRVD